MRMAIELKNTRVGGCNAINWYLTYVLINLMNVWLLLLAEVSQFLSCYHSRHHLAHAFNVLIFLKVYNLYAARNSAGTLYINSLTLQFLSPSSFFFLSASREELAMKIGLTEARIQVSKSYVNFSFNFLFQNDISESTSYKSRVLQFFYTRVALRFAKDLFTKILSTVVENLSTPMTCNLSEYFANNISSIMNRSWFPQ